MNHLRRILAAVLTRNSWAGTSFTSSVTSTSRPVTGGRPSSAPGVPNKPWSGLRAG
jgi:hypothetical protein